uniref:Uncharacterized protein n=1 Tax=Romanomermis culicivorax TaxID=13658 RepID=A0A915HGE9_ROMCU
MSHEFSETQTSGTRYSHLYLPFTVERNAIDTLLPNKREIFVLFVWRLPAAERFKLSAISSVPPKKASRNDPLLPFTHADSGSLHFLYTPIRHHYPLKKGGLYAFHPPIKPYPHAD